MRDDEDFARWLKEDNTSLGEGLLRLSELLQSKAHVVDYGVAALDDLAASVTDASVNGIVAALFGVDGLRADVEDYHAEENSFLDRVLERRLGMPITLSAVVIEVGSRIGLTLSMVGMPGHVVVGTSDPDLFICLLYTSPSPRDATLSRMPSSA